MDIRVRVGLHCGLIRSISLSTEISPFTPTLLQAESAKSELRYCEQGRGGRQKFRAQAGQDQRLLTETGGPDTQVEIRCAGQPVSIHTPCAGAQKWGWNITPCIKSNRNPAPVTGRGRLLNAGRSRGEVPEYCE